jgi:methylated-DNA-[protein]-cysteine S-methyltransferase
MTQKLNYIVFNTDMGWMGILGSAKGLRRTTLPCPSPQEARQLLGESINAASWSPHIFGDLIHRLKLYFAGHKVNFPDELDLSGATRFQQAVWEATRLIPYGETKSYAWIAAQINQPKALRAVGQALRANPLPIIIPCHRVLRNNGSLGGFSHGIEMKRKLLYLESLTAN